MKTNSLCACTACHVKEMQVARPKATEGGGHLLGGTTALLPTYSQNHPSHFTNVTLSPSYKGYCNMVLISYDRYLNFQRFYFVFVFVCLFSFLVLGIKSKEKFPKVFSFTKKGEMNNWLYFKLPYVRN